MKKLADIFKSLEDETRLRIIALLLEREELCVCHFMAVLQLPQSTVSRHLAHLKNAGWLSDRRAGVWRHYSLAPELGSSHRIMAAALRDMLAADGTAGQDRKRLEQLGNRQCCT
ncbi:MAG: metalloregulator ArsR/SmtB family transcription factor [Syntrophales bacterium]